MFSKIYFFLTLVLVSAHRISGITDKIICFDASWAIYRSNQGSFKPENINPNICTHVLYAFLGVNPDGTLKILDPWNEINLRSLSKIQALKQVNPNLKVLISIGGHNAGNGILNGVAASSKLRQNLVKSCISFFNEWGYDGIDVNWEYPRNSDKANFVKLLTEMRKSFDENGYILSVTAAATPLASYEVSKISSLSDLLNLITFEFYIPDNGKTGHNSPLYGAKSINASVISWLDAGADPSKLTVGVPFYGHTYSLINDDNHYIGATASTGIGGPYSHISGVLGYNEICQFYNDWTRVWDDEAQVPYRYDGSNWLSYDDPKSIGLKAKYAKDHGLAGIMVWSLDYDDFRGLCGTKHVLLKAIKKNF